MSMVHQRTKTSPPDILVATDGSAATDGAVFVATRLAEREGLDMELLIVLRDRPSLPAAEDAELRVRLQLRALSAAGEDCRIEVRSGPAARTIAKVARGHGARLIVMGASSHGVPDWIPGARTMTRLLPLTETPLLAIPASLRAIPSRVLVAMDFRMASITAARAAIEVAGNGAHIDLVHVEPTTASPGDAWNHGEECYEGGARGGFERLLADLQLPRRQEVETWTLSGDASSELLRFAKRSGCDLIAAGGRGHGMLERGRDRSVTRALVQSIGRSLLIAPQRSTSVWRAPSATAEMAPHEGWTQSESPLSPVYAR